MSELSDLMKAINGERPPFFVGLAVYSPEKDALLIGKRKEDGIWTGPGGGAEAGESPIQAAMREAFEEANLILEKEWFQELSTNPTKDGRPCHCYLVTLPNTPETAVFNDPDKEVREWKWLSNKDPLPEPLSEGRRKTLLEARMFLAKKSNEQSTMVVSTQDMIDEHKKLINVLLSPSHEDDIEEAKDQSKELEEYQSQLNKGQAVPVGSISPSGKYKKIAPGKWEEIKREAEQGSKEESSEADARPIHHVDVHFNYQGRQMAHRFSIRARGHQEAKDRALNAIAKFEKIAGRVELLKVQAFNKEKEDSQQKLSDRFKDMRKSLASSEIAGIDINTADYSMADIASEDHPFLDQLNALTKDSIYNNPMDISLPDLKHTLTLYKVDDGLYSGHVRRSFWEVNSGQSGDTVFQVVKMTVPDIVQALKAKQYLQDEVKIQASEEEEDESAIKQIVAALVSTLLEHKAEAKIPELTSQIQAELDHPGVLTKGKPFPIGTVRDWGGIKYVKHADGWVVMGGQHHGKMMGKFKEEATHTKVADEAKAKFEIPSEGDAKHSVEPEDQDKADEKAAEAPKKEASRPKNKAKDFEGMAEGNPRTDSKEELNKEDYINARDSKFSNKGEDILDSARHKAAVWKGLSSAESDGTAEELVHRDSLLKIYPSKISDSTTSENYLSAFALQKALERLPPAPTSVWLKGWEDRSNDTPRYYVVATLSGTPRKLHPSEYERLSSEGNLPGELLDTVTVGELKVEARKNYLEMYEKIKGMSEDVLKSLSSQDGNDAAKTLEVFRNKIVSDVIRERRTRDRYDEIANSLVTYVNKTLSPRRATTRSVAGDLKNLQAAAKDLDPQSAADKVKDVISGKDFKKTFGIKSEKGEGPKKFSAAELYVDHAERTGPETGLETPKEQEKFLLKNGGIRGLQWGNSVTDEEREHHLKFAANAFKDLVEVLGLPEQMVSFNGRLGLAIGARGKGNALAHYEPDNVVINLTRKGGVGSLAHEWGHFFDNIAAQVSESGKFVSSRAGAMAENPYFKDKESENPTLSAMSALYSSPSMKAFKTRLHQKLREDKGLGPNRFDYWSSDHEIFARSFELYVQNKLKDKGRSNTYLAGVTPSPLWPNDEEMKGMAPLFDNIFEAFKSSEDLKKAMELLVERLERFSG